MSDGNTKRPRAEIKLPRPQHGFKLITDWVNYHEGTRICSLVSFSLISVPEGDHVPIKNSLHSMGASVIINILNKMPGTKIGFRA